MRAPRTNAGDPGILGRTVRLNEESFTVIGVIPSTLGSFVQLEMYTPAAFTPEQKSTQRRGDQYLFTLGRLKGGLTVEQAQRDINVFGQDLAKEFPDNYPPTAGWGIRIQPLSEILAGGEMRLLVLLGAVGFVFLIACANVANLLLARAAARAKEISVRSALGASWWRIARQLMTESVLLRIAGVQRASCWVAG